MDLTVTIFIVVVILVVFILIIQISKTKQSFRSKLLFHTNPKSKLAGKLAGKLAVVSYDNRSTKEIELLKKVNQKYCAKHGYDFLFYHQYQDEMTYPPYWLKVKIVQDVLKSNRYQYVMWMDSDACFHNDNQRIESLIPDTQTFFVKSSESGPHHFNAGIWLVQNSMMGHDFLKDWLAKYNADNWDFQNGTWTCKINKYLNLESECAWSEDQYEQGSGNRLLQTPKYKPFYHHVHGDVMQRQFPKPESFTVHFYLDAKKNIEYYVTKFNK